MGPRFLQSQIHADYSTGSTTWSDYRNQIKSMYDLSTSKVDFNDHLIREYNRKIERLNQETGLYIAPFDGGFRFIGETISSLLAPSLFDGLKAFWNLEDLTEASGTGLDLTNNGGVTFEVGKIGNGAVFNGTDQYLEFDNEIMQFPSQERTITAWVYPNSVGISVIFGNNNNTPFFLYNNDGVIQLCEFLPDGNLFNGAGNPLNTTAVPLNQWSFVAARYDLSTQEWSAWVNDTKVTISHDFGPVSSRTITRAVIGCNLSGGINLEHYFDGKIDALAIWDRALSDTEIAQLYNSGNGLQYNQLTNQLVAYWKLDETSGTRFDSYGSLDLTESGGTGFDSGKIANAATFSNNYLFNYMNNDFTNGFSISLWFKLNDLPIGVYGHIAGENDFYNQSLYRYTVQLENGYIRFASAYNNTSLIGPNVSINQWYHIVVSVSNGSMQFYVNGSLVDSEAVGGVGNHIPTVPFTLGSLIDNNEQIDGIIDEVGIWSRPLTQQEIIALYNNGNSLPYNQF